MSKLPYFQTDDKNLSLLQTGWSSLINPVLSEAILDNNILANIQLSSGTNVINHKLGRPLRGWWIVRQRAAASFYDLQDTNPNASVSLFLNSSGNVSVDILVF